MNYLGIDWGEKRIGLAVASDDVSLATPYSVVGNIDEIKEVVNAEEVECIVVGKPVKMSGSSVGMTKGFVTFIDELKEKIHLPIELIDERLTSKAADSLAINGGKGKLTKKKRKTSADRDAVAAMLILQSYLDQHA